MSDHAYHEQNAARAHLEAARERISKVVMESSADVIHAIADRLDTLADELEAERDEREAHLPKTYDGYEIGVAVEVLDHRGRWLRGVVEKHETARRRPTLGVRVLDPTPGVPPFLWGREIGEPSLRKAA